MAIPHVLILRAPGTNCDREAAFAFEHAGATTERIHINALRENPSPFTRAQILVLPGGFSYGDDISAGKILASQLQHYLADTVHEFRAQGKLILGICNGFQALIKSGILIPPDPDEGPLLTLAHNTSGRFVDRWVQLRVDSQKSPFLKEIETLDVPVAHGEGRIVARKDWILKGLDQTGQIVLRYHDPFGRPARAPWNPNGSQDDIAGLCDASGHVLGLMPHPERNVLPTHHPLWTRRPVRAEGAGLALFRNAVQFFA
jgi:phosphoribosylformylglycinamidine synthase